MSSHSRFPSSFLMILILPLLLFGQNSFGYLNSSVQLADTVSFWTLGVTAPEDVSDSSIPLIVYLHGGIGTTRTDKGIEAYEMYRFIADSIPVVIASPSSNRYAPWWSQVGINRILTTVDYICENHNIDRSKIFLAGVSDGATGLFPVASLQSHPFAGFIGASGYPLLFENKLTIDNLASTPIHLYISGNDRLYPSGQVVQYCNELQTYEVPITYTLYENEEHGFDFRFQERDSIIRFINNWKKY